MTSLRQRAFVAILCATTACISSSYDDKWGTDDVLSGKSDGIADGAITLELGKAVTGAVDSQSIVLYKLRLRRGDKLNAKKTVTSGDLSPHFALIHNFTESVGSDDFEVTDTTLTKTFEVKVTGNYFVMVRAFAFRGAGDFELLIDCTGGPCNGEFPTEFLEAQDADLCLEQAQQCAFERMARHNGAVGPARAAALLDECLADFGTADGNSCLEACDKQPDHGASSADLVCHEIARDIEFYADQSSACLEVLDECLDLCGSMATRVPGGELLGQPFSMCWSFGLNGTCPSYARTVSECGGNLDTGSEAECFELCDATDGAHTQDVEQTCNGICE